MKTTILLFIISFFINGVVSTEIESVSVYKGDHVTLHAHLTDIKKDYVIEWRFGDEQDLIARINGVANSQKIFDDVLDGRFRDRLQLNTATRDLTITNITTQQSGDYKLFISKEKHARKTFSISVFGYTDKVKIMGDSVILHNNVTKKPGDKKMVWKIRHNNSPVAEIIRNGKERNDTVHERFRDRLQVDDQTGVLNITNITTQHTGDYEVEITVGSNTHTIHRSFNVPVNEQGLSSGLSSGVAAEIYGVLGVAAAAAAVGFIIYRQHSRTTRKRVSKDEDDASASL